MITASVEQLNEVRQKLKDAQGAVDSLFELDIQTIWESGEYNAVYHMLRAADGILESTLSAKKKEVRMDKTKEAH